jgi:DHA1 family bicyclomycin/chloramphenicol resistance-like MFS transporter
MRGVVMYAPDDVRVEESLPPQRRHGGGLRNFVVAGRQVLRNRSYVGYLLVAGSAMVAM